MAEAQPQVTTTEQPPQQAELDMSDEGIMSRAMGDEDAPRDDKGRFLPKQTPEAQTQAQAEIAPAEAAT
ncbi:MAG: hypothetical protein ACREUY_02855, partial [Burkholderiales bacterium]